MPGSNAALRLLARRTVAAKVCVHLLGSPADAGQHTRERPHVRRSKPIAPTARGSAAQHLWRAEGAGAARPILLVLYGG